MSRYFEMYKCFYDTILHNDMEICSLILCLTDLMLKRSKNMRQLESLGARIFVLYILVKNMFLLCSLCTCLHVSHGHISFKDIEVLRFVICLMKFLHMDVYSQWETIMGLFFKEDSKKTDQFWISILKVRTMHKI